MDANLSPAEMEAIERLNKEILALKEQIAQQEGGEDFGGQDASQ
jgi:hypothetical protein